MVKKILEDMEDIMGNTAEDMAEDTAEGTVEAMAEAIVSVVIAVKAIRIEIIVAIK